MKASRLVLIFVLACSSASVARAAQKAQAADSPAAVVRELYRLHRNGNGHVFDKSGRRYQQRFFDEKLAGLIWKDLTQTPEGEVGALDFDPLYDAQDMRITNFRVGDPAVEGAKVEVPVTFDNFGKRTLIKFRMVKEGGAWKIENIIYPEGFDLVKILSTPQ
jgi:hypothetical protein